MFFNHAVEAHMGNYMAYLGLNMFFGYCMRRIAQHEDYQIDLGLRGMTLIVHVCVVIPRFFFVILWQCPLTCVFRDEYSSDDEVLGKVWSHLHLALWHHGLWPDAMVDLPLPCFEPRVEWNIFPEDGPLFTFKWYGDESRRETQLGATRRCGCRG